MSFGKQAAVKQKPNRLPQKRNKNSLGAMQAKKGKILFLLALPVIAYVIIFGYVPLWGLGYAFVKYRLGRPMLQCDFVGLKNFTVLFENPVIRKNIINSIRNTLGMAGINYLLLFLPMAFAIFVNELRSAKFKKLFQTISTLPNFVSWVVVFSLANALLSSTGLINSLLVEWGWLEEPFEFFLTDKLVWIKLEILERWKGLGWSGIVYFAAIAGIDQEQFEAAAIDGAGRWARIRYITVPHLMPTVVVLLIMGMGRILNTGWEVYYIFENAYNRDWITTLDLYVYHLGLGQGMISYSVAVGMMKSIIGITLFYVSNFIAKKVRGSGIA